MTLLRRSVTKLVLALVLITVPSIFIARFFSQKATLAFTRELLDNKIENYGAKILGELGSIRNVLDALGAVFYNGTFEREEDTLQTFINFTNLYPKSTGFYGELNDHYYDGTLWVPDEGWVAKERPWYSAGQKGAGKVVFSDLYTDAQTGLAVTSVSKELREKDGKLLGVIALDYPLDSVVETVSALKSEGGAANSHKDEIIYIITNTGNFAVSDKYKAEDVFSEVDGGAFRAIAPAIMTGGARFEKAKLGGVPYLFNSTKLGDTGWLLVVGESERSTFSFVRECSVMLTLSICALGALVLVLICFSIAAIAKPLKMTSKALKEIASGSADLTKRLVITDKSDEMRSIGGSFNEFVEHLQLIIKEIKETKNDLFTYGKFLGELVQNNATFVEKMTLNIKSVDGELDTQHQKVKSTVASGADISSSVDSLNELLFTQKRSVDDAIGVVGQMVKSINSVSTSVEKMADEFDALKATINGGINSQKEVSKRITEIEEQSKALNDANRVIASISEQTNLLAMNAAIEATHAGNAGKGFAVVATEIRKLSENSARQSTVISDQLSLIVETIEKAVANANSSDAEFGKVWQKLDSTAAVVSSIKTSMEEQFSNSKKIDGALGFMSDATKQVEGAAAAVDSSRKNIKGNTAALNQSSDAVHDSLQNMEENVRNIEDDDKKLLALASQINTALYRINNQIDQFQL